MKQPRPAGWRHPSEDHADPTTTGYPVLILAVRTRLAELARTRVCRYAPSGPLWPLSPADWNNGHRGADSLPQAEATRTGEHTADTRPRPALYRDWRFSALVDTRMGFALTRSPPMRTTACRRVVWRLYIRPAPEPRRSGDSSADMLVRPGVFRTLVRAGFGALHEFTGWTFRHRRRCRPAPFRSLKKNGTAAHERVGGRCACGRRGSGFSHAAHASRACLAG
jgi:hypothetical protein